MIVRSFRLGCSGWFDSKARIAEFKAALAALDIAVTITSAKIVGGEAQPGAAKPFRIAVDFGCPTVRDAAALALIAGSTLTL